MLIDAVRDVGKHLDAGKSCCARSLEELESVDNPTPPVDLTPLSDKQPEIESDDVSETTSSIDYMEDKVYWILRGICSQKELKKDFAQNAAICFYLGLGEAGQIHG